MPTITQLEYIVSVHENKNFSKAAAECHVSQPSLSAQVHKVEEILNTVIFDRTKKPVRTTPLGIELIKQIKTVLKEHRKLYDISQNTGVLRGSFRLGVIPSLSSYILPLFIENFSKKHAQVDIKVSELKTDDIVKALADETIDAGLLVTPLYKDQVKERPLFYEKFYVYTSLDHPLSKKTVVSNSDLDTDSVWLLEEGHCFRDQVIRVCSLDKKNHVLENVSFESGSLETLVNLIRQGRGYTLLPELATYNLPSHEKKKRLKKFKRPIPTREVSLVTNKEFTKSKIIEALEKEIVSSLPKEVLTKNKKDMEIVDI